MTDDSEVWGKDRKCTACRVACADKKEQREHLNTKSHSKKWEAKKFIEQHVSQLSTTVSQMQERYKQKNLPIIGLDQCIEIQQVTDQEKDNFWVCNLCYEAGETYESADIHLTSMQHIKNVLDENECEEIDEIECKYMNDECDKYEKYCDIATETFKRNGGVKGIPSAQVIRMNLSTADGRKHLGIEDQSDISFTERPNSDQCSVLYCSTCNEISPVHTTGKFTIEKARSIHFNSGGHQKYASIRAVMKEFHQVEVYDIYKSTELHMNLRWIEKSPNSWYLSQPVGCRYSIEAGSDTVCMICYAFVDSEKTLEHCASEFHVMKYLNQLQSCNAYNTSQLVGPERRMRARKMVMSAYSLENDCKSVAPTLSRLPRIVRSQLYQDVQKYLDPLEDIIDDFKDSTKKVFRFCNSCNTYIEFDVNLVATPDKMNATWKNHVRSAQHFETAAMRKRIYFDPQYFVPFPPTIKSSIDTDMQGVWKVNKDVLVQTQCDVGLEYIVEDELANEVSCQLCWKIFPKNPVIVNLHIRSYDHLKQYIFLNANDCTRTLLGPEPDSKKQAFLLDWLRRNSGSFEKGFRLYSKLKSLELSTWTPISRRFVHVSHFIDGSVKEVYETISNLVDLVACDGAENDTMSAREALIASRMLIVQTTRGNQNELGTIVCKCENCEQHLVANAGTWQQDVFSNHVYTTEHQERMLQCGSHTMSAFGILPEKSTYTVKPFVQKDLSKKVVWQWNGGTKQHEYVASVVGLNDIVEHRFPGMEFGQQRKLANFYCQLCAVTFQKRAATLESHVRNMDHCINWVKKYRIPQLRDLFNQIANQAADKGKELRKFLSGILKDVHPPEDYCMLVYDPFGEEERNQNEILKKLQLEEKKQKAAEEEQKSKAAKALKAQQQEERRKQCEERAKVERARIQQENQRREEEQRKKKAERDARRQYAEQHVEKFMRKDTPEEAALKNRLQQASHIENEKKQMALQKARLEAEKNRLLAQNPYAATKSDPKLIIFPQLKTQPTTRSPYGMLPTPDVPSDISIPESSIFNQQPPPVSFFGTPQSSLLQNQRPATGRFSMNFSNIQPIHHELPGFTKRPSLRGRRVDFAIHDTNAIKNKANLLAYMRQQGADSILESSEIPHEFNKAIQDSPDACGACYVAEVICLDDPSLDTYLCTACDNWSSPKGMLKHLSSSDHKSSYMYHKYPDHHAEVNREKNPQMRRKIFQNFTNELKMKNIGDLINTRMKTLIDRKTIERLWPGFEDYFYKETTSTAWTCNGFKPVAGPPIVLPKVAPVATLVNDDDDEVIVIDNVDVTRENNDERGRVRSRSRSRDRIRRSRSRENRRHRSNDRRRSRSRSRSRSRDRHLLDRDRGRTRRDRRSRSRSRSKSRSLGSQQKTDQPSWAEQTESFLARLQRGSERQPVPPTPQNSSTASDYISKLATIRDMTNSGFIQGTPIERTSVSPVVTPAPVVSSFSTEDRRRAERARLEEQAMRDRRVLGILSALDDLAAEYKGNAPQERIEHVYRTFAISEEEAKADLTDFVSRSVEQKSANNVAPKQNISQSILSLGIQLNPSTQTYNQESQYSQQAVSSAQQQYGILSQPSTSSSAYAQAFLDSSSKALSPISAAIVPLQLAQKMQSFYQNPPTAINHQGSSSGKPSSSNNVIDSEDSSDDEDYNEVLQVLNREKQPLSGRNTEKIGGVSQNAASGKEKVEEPMIPGQRMALKRTILPNGARVGDIEDATPIALVAPVVAASPTPSNSSSSNTAIMTPNLTSSVSTPIKIMQQPERLPNAPDLRMPAPIAVTRSIHQSQHQQPQMVYQAQQGYQLNHQNQHHQQFQQQSVYQQPPVPQPIQYQQQMYQQSPSQPQYAQQYGIQQGINPQHPPRQQVYQQERYQSPVPQYEPQQQQQQYYQQPPQLQSPVQDNAAPHYGISGAPPQYYWPPQ